MMVINTTLIILIVSLIAVLYLISNIQKRRSDNKLTKYFVNLCIFLIIYLIGLILQIMFSKTVVQPIYFDYITYIAIVFIPVSFFAIAQEYGNGKRINIKGLIIIPIISLLILWTNDIHHLFYIKYSVNLDQSVQRFIFIYTYNIFIFVINIFIHSSNKSCY